MNDINNVVLVGRLTRKPELRQAGEYTVCNFTIANNRNVANKEYVSFIDCQAWSKLGEVVAKYTDKGSRVCVSGKLFMNRFTTKEGTNVSKILVNAEVVQFLDNKKKEEKGDLGFNDAIPFE